LKMKLGLILLLCLLSISIVCNVAITTLRAPAFSSQGNNSAQGDVKYNLLDDGNYTQLCGEDKGGGGWP
jgi:hypothetical protein